MKISQPLLAALQNTILQHDLIAPGDTVLVAVSGGADSVCLLHALHRLQQELQCALCAAHVNHMLRGSDADEDEAYVRTLCESLDVPLAVKRVDVRALAAAEKVTLEEAGRMARYAFFAEQRKVRSVQKVATAHNKNDQAETVLMRVMRGTGIEGLRGIQYRRADQVIRPLLDIARADIEAYCRENGLRYQTDATNLEPAQTRSRIRNLLLPLLQEQFNPDIVSALARLAQNTGEDADFLDAYARRLYQRLNSPMPSHKPVVLHIESLQMIGPAIQARLVLLAAQDAMHAPDYRLERKHILDILALCGQPTGTSLSLPQGLQASVEYSWLYFKDSRQDTVPEDKEFCIEAKAGGTYRLPNGAGRVTLAWEPAGYRRAEGQMVLDRAAIGDAPLTLRSRRKGDRFIYDPSGKSKKLSRYLIDQKMPRDARDKMTLLCCGDVIAAIIGQRVAAPFYTDANTEEVLVVTYESDAD